jgi:hypothetical protein
MESEISSHSGGRAEASFLLVSISTFERAGLTEFGTQYNIGAFICPSGWVLDVNLCFLSTEEQVNRV